MDQTIEERLSPSHRYERGLVLKRVQIFDNAIEEFQQAATDPRYAGEAHVQIGLCLNSAGRFQEAIAAFRQALTYPPFTSENSVRILYLLGRVLESLDHKRGPRFSRRGAPHGRSEFGARPTRPTPTAGQGLGRRHAQILSGTPQDQITISDLAQTLTGMGLSELQ